MSVVRSKWRIAEPFIEGRDSPKVRVDPVGTAVFSEVYQGFGVECDKGTLWICQRDGTLEINLHRAGEDRWFRLDFEEGECVPQVSAEQALRMAFAEESD